MTQTTRAIGAFIALLLIAAALIAVQHDAYDGTGVGHAQRIQLGDLERAGSARSSRGNARTPRVVADGVIVGQVEREAEFHALDDRLNHATVVELPEWTAEQVRIWNAAVAENARKAKAAADAAAAAAKAATSSSSGKVAATGTSMWVVLADCESGDGQVGPPFSMNPGARGTFSGAFQFLDSTWRSTTGLPGRAADYSYATQLEAAQKLQAKSGWGQWPSCTRRMRAAGYL